MCRLTCPVAGVGRSNSGCLLIRASVSSVTCPPHHHIVVRDESSVVVHRLGRSERTRRAAILRRCCCRRGRQSPLSAEGPAYTPAVWDAFVVGVVAVDRFAVKYGAVVQRRAGPCELMRMSRRGKVAEVGSSMKLAQAGRIALAMPTVRADAVDRSVGALCVPKRAGDEVSPSVCVMQANANW